jgi:hypothetical protein
MNTRPSTNEVISVAEQNREIAEKLFGQSLPCAVEMVFYIEKFTRLNTASKKLATQYFLCAAESFFQDEKPSITTLFRLSDCFKVLTFDSAEFLAKLTLFLSSTRCNQLMKLLSQRAVYELFREDAHPKFADIALPIATLSLPSTSQHWGTLYGQQGSAEAAKLTIDANNTTQGVMFKL